MEKRDVIEKFSSKRPEAVGVFGYGSGVFKQVRSDEGDVQTDVIFAVDDIRTWHMINMENNPGDYSFIGKIHLSRKNVAKIKGRNNITYFSSIQDQGFRFKYGVIEIQDFLASLSTWNNLFIAGRFQKPILNIQSEDFIDDVIQYNRKCALFVACLFSDKVTTMVDIYDTLCSLSYLGDARMRFAENPNKVQNIVNGSLESFKEIYPLEQDFIVRLDNKRVFIKHDVLLERIRELPEALIEFLEAMETDFDDLDMVRINTFSYFLTRNKIESRSQIFEGVKTNGLVRSVPYVLSKVRKRFIGR